MFYGKKDMNAVRHRLEQLVLSMQQLFGLLALGDVLFDRQEMGDSPLAVPDG